MLCRGRQPFSLGWQDKVVLLEPRGRSYSVCQFSVFSLVHIGILRSSPKIFPSGALAQLNLFLLSVGGLEAVLDFAPVFRFYQMTKGRI